MNPILLAFPVLAVAFVADQPISQIGPTAPVVTRDSIKADRDKFEREYKLDTKRPWDGTNLASPKKDNGGSAPPD